MKNLKISVWESLYGNVRYNVDFTDIQCVFDYYMDTSIDEIEKCGMAIHAAKEFKERRWFLTDEKILVCGRVPEIGTLRVSIDVVENLQFLFPFSCNNGRKIRDGYAVQVEIEGLDLPDGVKTFPRGGFWVNFLGKPE